MTLIALVRPLLCRSWLVAAWFLLNAPPAVLAAGFGWSTLPNAPIADGRHDDLFFIDTNRGWVVNGDGQIYRTTDAGASWVRQFLSPGTYFRAVGFATSQRGWVGNLEGNPLFYTTTNGGTTWVPQDNVPNPRPTGICGISVVSQSVVYACGRFDGPARVIKTTNGGNTWTSKDLSALATSLIDIYFVDANHGLAVGGIGSSFDNRRAVVLGTTDGGATWQTRHTTNRLGEWCWKINFPTPLVGYVSIERFSGTAFFLKTTDGGQTWQDMFFSINYEEQGVGFVTPSLGWIGGWTGPIYETTDGGTTWVSANFGEQVNRFRMLSSTFGYAVGETVYKYSPATAGLALDPLAASASRFRLAAGYPNPFQETTTIGYSLMRDADVEITIYNALGRRVVTLADGHAVAGTHALPWNGRDASGTPVGSGVYWVRFESDGEAQSKPLVVSR
jgi:photosystem II stability/assembly factor-like uncharacterized protein